MKKKSSLTRAERTAMINALVARLVASARPIVQIQETPRGLR
jgi:hypothetical protein